GGIDSDRVARKNAKAIVALSHQAFDQLRLQVEFPLGRHLEVDSGDAKILLCVGGGLLPGSEIRMRAPGDERDLIAGSFRAAGENGERRRKDPQYANRMAFHRFSSPSSKALCRFWSAGDWRRLRIWHAIVVCKASGTAASERPRRRRVRPPPPPRRRAEGVDLRKAEAPARHDSTRPHRANAGGFAFLEVPVDATSLGRGLRNQSRTVSAKRRLPQTGRDSWRQEIRA